MKAREFKTLAELDLAPATNTAVARELLGSWVAPNSEQEETRQRMLAFIAEHPKDAHQRSCVPGHLTASGLLFDHAGERALLTLHKKLGRWLQLGGHCDGDANLVACAVREAQEESGIDALEIDPVPIDLDIHLIPARPGEPEHLHLDTRFILRAAEGAVEAISDESLELRWFSRTDLDGIETDPSVVRLLGTEKKEPDAHGNVGHRVRRWLKSRAATYSDEAMIVRASTLPKPRSRSELSLCTALQYSSIRAIALSSSPMRLVSVLRHLTESGDIPYPGCVCLRAAIRRMIHLAAIG